MEVVAELTKRCIEENSTTAQDQAAYLERYNGLAERYETAKAKLEKLQAVKAKREAKAEDIGGFMFELAEYGDPITEFDDRLWLTVIDIVTVHRQDASRRFFDGALLPMAGAIVQIGNQPVHKPAHRDGGPDHKNAKARSKNHRHGYPDKKVHLTTRSSFFEPIFCAV